MRPQLSVAAASAAFPPSSRRKIAPRRIEPDDQRVGARIRIRRKDLGISQQGLAEGLGLTFQQVQKYERAANRVSASKLYEIAALLEAPVAWFFDGLTESGSTPGERNAADTSSLLTRFASAPGAREVMAAWPNVPRAQQTALANLARDLGVPAADEDEWDRAVCMILADQPGGRIVPIRMRCPSRVGND